MKEITSLRLNHDNIVTLKGRGHKVSPLVDAVLEALVHEEKKVLKMIRKYLK